MNIQLTDSHIREHLSTTAKPSEIAKYLSLCGPSVESLTKKGNEYIYDIEVTTNRVDMSSARGIAREAAAILPRFGIKAQLKKLSFKKPISGKKIKLNIHPNHALVGRVMAVELNDVKNVPSPKYIKDRLETAGIRSLGSVIDITNYVMLDLGHPTHVFDYDKLIKGDLLVRESKAGEKFTGLDDKTYTLAGGDIVFDDGNGNIIDLPGILGAKNSSVGEGTKNILFFIDNNDKAKIRRSSMSLGIRTMAATLNEKGIDPYLADIAILKGIELYQEICAAKVGSKIYDNFSSPPKAKQLNVKKTKINTLLGMEIDKKEITAHLEALGYTAKWSGDNLTTTPPTWRITDTAIPEDIIEEIARIEGYHNLPSTLMSGDLPSKISMQANYFASISDIKSELKALGGTEIMTLSLVSKEGVSDDALKLKNPLGKDTKYLRTSMKLSLINVTEENLGWSEPYHIFEISNTYQPAKGSLPNEVLTLAGIIHGEKFRNAKGIIEHLLSTKFKGAKFRKSSARTLDIIIGGNKSGLFDASDPKNIYYEINISDAQVNFNRDVQIINLPKHPPQIEDITLKIDPLTPVGNVYNTIKNSHKNVQTVELVDQYKRNFTFRIYYQDPAKTLTDQEVASLRKIIEGRLKKLDTKI